MKHLYSQQRSSSQLGGIGNIVGITFNDLDADGIFDSEDLILPGITVYLELESTPDIIRGASTSEPPVRLSPQSAPS